jgi:hypothetical protein
VSDQMLVATEICSDTGRPLTPAGLSTLATPVAPALTRRPADLSQGERCYLGSSTVERLDGPGRRVSTAGALPPLRRGA